MKNLILLFTGLMSVTALNAQQISTTLTPPSANTPLSIEFRPCILTNWGTESEIDLRWTEQTSYYLRMHFKGKGGELTGFASMTLYASQGVHWTNIFNIIIIDRKAELTAPPNMPVTDPWMAFGRQIRALFERESLESTKYSVGACLFVCSIFPNLFDPDSLLIFQRGQLTIQVPSQNWLGETPEVSDILTLGSDGAAEDPLFFPEKVIRGRKLVPIDLPKSLAERRIALSKREPKNQVLAEAERYMEDPDRFHIKMQKIYKMTRP